MTTLPLLRRLEFYKSLNDVPEHEQRLVDLDALLQARAFGLRSFHSFTAREINQMQFGRRLAAPFTTSNFHSERQDHVASRRVLVHVRGRGHPSTSTLSC